jgi:hypothetical protein
MVSLGIKQAPAGRPARARLPAWHGSARLAHAPGRTQGPTARGAIQGSGEGQGAAHAPALGHGQSARRSGPPAGGRRPRAGPVGPRRPRAPLAGRRRRASRHLEGPLGATPGAPTVSLPRQRRAEQAPRSPALVCKHVWPLSDRAFLRDASRQTHPSRAPGRAQGTAPPYADPLAEHRRDLPARRRGTRSMALPVARGWLAQAGGPQRPRGPPGGEAKRVQRAGGLRVEAICAPAGPACSPGGRPGHRPPQARHALREPCRPWHSHALVEAAVRGWCATIAHGLLREGRKRWGKEGGIWRRSGTWRQAGGWEAGTRTSPDQGPPPGGVASPRVAHVCLPQVVAAWCAQDGQPRRQGRGLRTRGAEEWSRGGELEAAARRGRAVRPKRCNRFRLTMPPAKPAFMACKKPPRPEPGARGPGSFDCLGLPHAGAKTRRGDGVSKRKTGGKRRRRCRPARWTWGRATRQAPVHEPYRTMGAPRRGEDQDAGIRGNCQRLDVVGEPTERAWRSWRRRGSPKGHRRGPTCVASLQQPCALPNPRSRPNISSCQGQQGEAPNGVSPGW